MTIDWKKPIVLKNANYSENWERDATIEHVMYNGGEGTYVVSWGYSSRPSSKRYSAIFDQSGWPVASSPEGLLSLSIENKKEPDQWVVYWDCTDRIDWDGVIGKSRVFDSLKSAITGIVRPVAYKNWTTGEILTPNQAKDRVRLEGGK